MTPGLVGLWYSRKAMFCLIMFATASTAVFMKLIEGGAYAAIVASIVTAWTASHTWQQVNGDNKEHGMGADVKP